ncbi:PfkB family carbohydrate kinase [Streptomyces sp. NPDC047002]|uniref:1-phosphofructokinase family hexose kinase n=1 Tax=Streptomyces sp. NPDC047002 TaxID=3155475 RepID=UPI003456A006
MTIAIASANSAVERLLVVAAHRPGTVHRLVRSETLAGGKGVNVARVLAALGPDAGALGGGGERAVPPPLLFGLRGGATGRLFHDLLRAEGLRCDLADTADATRVNEVLVDRSAPDGATVYNAAGPTVTEAELASLDEVFTRTLAEADALVCTGSIPPGMPDAQYARWIERARARGAATVLDAHGPALAAGAAAAPDVVKVNRDELEAVPGGRGAAATVRAWLEGGVRCVVVTDGGGPFRVSTRDAEFEVAPPRVPVRSAVGSGDAFCAGLVHSMLGAPGAGWPRHLRAAAACGASNAASETAGLSAGLPPRALLDQAGVRTRAPRTPRAGTARG